MIFLFPTCFSRLIVNLLPNMHIGKRCKIGFSLILCDKLDIADDCSIGHLNIIANKSLVMISRNKLRHLNRISGNFDMVMHEQSWINSQNKIVGLHHKSYHRPVFVIGKKTAIIMGHQFDLTDSVIIGENVLFAGTGTQVWTHAFYLGTDKNVRIDGAVSIGDRCYIGSRSMICSGVNIVHDTTIGANTTVSKSLDKPGLYVSQPVRYIDFDADKAIESLQGKEVAPGVYRKN